jgi:methylase of polypeptide subunit release factors
MPGAEPEGGLGQNGSPAERVVVAPATIASWEPVEDFSKDLAVFETVFWEPADTVSLRQLIRETSLVKGKTVLEIGTGTGLLALCCLEAQAAKVVATDVNPAAIGNAAYNAQILGFTGRLDLRLVPLDDAGAYSVIGESEKFDLIISNPPWEDAEPATIDKYAYYDPGFGLLRSLLRDLKAHLRPGGKALLAYGSADAIRTLRQLADEYQLEVRVLDDRQLEGLPDVFLPGMLLELTPRPRRKDTGAFVP